MDIKKSLPPDANIKRLEESASLGVEPDPTALSDDDIPNNIDTEYGTEVNDEPRSLKWYQKIWLSLLALPTLFMGGQARATTPVENNFPSSSISSDDYEDLQVTTTDIVQIGFGSLETGKSQPYNERYFESVKNLERETTTSRGSSTHSNQKTSGRNHQDDQANDRDPKNRW